MTPQERARADEITAAIERFSKNRRQAPAVKIPDVSPKSPAPTIRPVSQERPVTSGNGLRYGLIFAVVLIIHAAGFVAYRHYSEKKDRETAELIAQIQAQATADRIAANEMAKAHLASLTAAMAEKSTRPNPSPKIEYNIYTPPAPAPRPQPAPQIIQQVTQQRAPAPATVDRTSEHTVIARNHLISKKGIWGGQAVTKQITGWEGRFRTEFEIARISSTGSPQPRRYEVITEEKNGIITAIDLTTKGY